MKQRKPFKVGEYVLANLSVSLSSGGDDLNQRLVCHAHRFHYPSQLLSSEQ